MKIASAKVLREQRREAKSRELEAVRTRLGISQSAAAASIGMARQHYQDLEDPAHPRNLGSADEEGLPIAMQIELLRAKAARLGMVCIEAPEDVTVEGLLEHLDALTEDTSATTKTLARAASEGGVGSDVAAELERRGGRLIAHGASLQEIGRAAKPPGPRIVGGGGS